MEDFETHSQRHKGVKVIWQQWVRKHWSLISHAHTRKQVSFGILEYPRRTAVVLSIHLRIDVFSQLKEKKIMFFTLYFASSNMSKTQQKICHILIFKVFLGQDSRVPAVHLRTTFQWRNWLAIATPRGNDSHIPSPPVVVIVILKLLQWHFDFPSRLTPGKNMGN